MVGHRSEDGRVAAATTRAALTGIQNPVVDQYRHRHSDWRARLPDPDDQTWEHVLIVPVYNETAQTLSTLLNSVQAPGRLLVILVFNCPESGDRSTHLRNQSAFLDCLPVQHDPHQFLEITPGIDALLLDTLLSHGPLPGKQGVGLARKIGADLALELIATGRVRSQWLAMTDADACLPDDYFTRLPNDVENCAAVVFPFTHRGVIDQSAIQTYELWLHYYVCGLEYARSPYAYHCLGSTMAINAANYAMVRGMPKRASAEDFHLLSKLKKTGDIRRLDGRCIELSARRSQRVPVGTGPSVRQIDQSGVAAWHRFYRPLCFDLLATVLRAFESELSLAKLLEEDSPMGTVLGGLGLRQALEHAARQSRDQSQYVRQLHNWFDALKTLRFIHALGEADTALEPISLQSLMQKPPDWWPQATTHALSELHARWGWRA